MYTVYLTADTVDADENFFDTMHDALAFVDEYVRQPDIWSLELWHGNEHIYTFAATYPHQRGEHCECSECINA